MAKSFTRREFLKVSTAAVGSAGVMSGLQSLMAARKAQADEGRLVTSTDDKIVPGICLLCPSGCGVITRVADGRAVKLEGNPMHPMNLGALCPKGQAAPELLYNPDRLTGPKRRVGERGQGEWEDISWEEAIQLVAGKLSELRADGHPERAALMYGEARGQLRPFFERFMEIFGSPNVVSRESLNVGAAKLAMYLTQGIYDMPSYDLENCSYVLSFGASLLEAGPVPQRMVGGYAFMRQGRAERGKVVIIDPRQGVSGAKADEWIPIIPGTDGALAMGMAHVIIRTGTMDSSFINNYSFGYDDVADETGTKLLKGFERHVLENYDPDTVEKITGISATTITRLAGEFAANKPSLAILPGKGGLLNGSISGVYAAMAVHMLNALVGSIDRSGGVMTQRYSPARPWPDVAADPIASQGCSAERVDGAGTLYPLARDSYQSVADRILDGYPLEALFLYDANPVYEAPGGKRFAEAFKKVPLVVAFTSFMDESAQYADLVLPEPTFLERYEDHDIEGLGFPGVGLRQPVIRPLHDTMSVGDFFLKVAADMGEPFSKAFPWGSYQALLRYRLLDVGTDWETLSELGVWMTPGYRFSRRGSDRWVKEVVGKDRRFAPRDGYFDFFSRELYCILGEMSEEQKEKYGLSDFDESINLPNHKATFFSGHDSSYPFMLNVVTIMALGPYSAAANMPTLQEISGMTVGETWDSWVEMNPEAAEERSLHDKDEVWVESPFGKVKTKLRLVKGVHPRVVNLPHNQGHNFGRFAKGRGVNGLELLNPASEPLTGLASFTNTRVRVYKA